MNLNNVKSVILASTLGIALILTGCKAADDTTATPSETTTTTTTTTTEQGSTVAGDMADKAADMADKAGDAATDAVNTGIEMASAAFDNSMELSEETAGAVKEKMEGAVTSLETEFNGMKETIDPPKAAEIEAKFASVKENLSTLQDKTGAELVEGLQEVRQKGSELSTELSNLKAGGTAGEAPEGAVTEGGTTGEGNAPVTEGTDTTTTTTDTTTTTTEATPATEAQ